MGKKTHLSKTLQFQGGIRYFNKKKNPCYWQTKDGLKNTLEIISSANSLLDSTPTTACFEKYWNCVFHFHNDSFFGLHTLTTTHSHHFKSLVFVAVNLHICFVKCPVMPELSADQCHQFSLLTEQPVLDNQRFLTVTTPCNTVVVAGTDLAPAKPLSI